MSWAMVDQFFAAFGETLLMVAASGFCASLVGIPLGLLLYLTRPGNALNHAGLHRLLQFVLRAVLSTPSVVLLASLIALAHMMLKAPADLIASVVPLTLIAMPVVARGTHDACQRVGQHTVHAARSAGASTWQIVYKVLLPQASGGIAGSLCNALAALVGYSALAGAIGGAGLGNLGLRSGFQEFLPGLMLLVVLTLLILAESMQVLGYTLSRRLDNNPRG